MEFSQGTQYTAAPEINSGEARRAASLCALASVAAILLSYGLVLMFSLIVKNAQIGERTYANLALIVSTAATNLIAMPCAWLLLLKRVPKQDPPLTDAPAAGLSFRSFAFYFPCAFALMYGGALLGRLIGMMLGGGLSDVVGNAIGSVSPWVTAVCAGVVGPVAEELFFRKAMIDRLKGYHPADAILYSALLFAMVHGNVTQFLYAFPLGLLFGFLYYRTKDIRLTIVLHIAVNLMGGVIPQLISPLSDTAEKGQLGSYVVIMAYSVTVLVLCVIGVVQLIRYRKQFLIRTPLPHRSREFFLNVGFIVACAVFAGLFVLSEIFV